MSEPKEFWENFPHALRGEEDFSNQPPTTLEEELEQSRRNKDQLAKMQAEAQSQAAPGPREFWQDFPHLVRAVEAFSKQPRISLEAKREQSRRNKAQLAAMQGPPKPPVPSVTCTAERFINAMHTRAKPWLFRERMERLTALLNDI